MSVSLCPIPKMQFFDNNGNVAAGYYLYTYQAGLPGVPKPTYTDSTGTVYNTDPIILDSAGRASIWLDGYYYMELWSGDKTVGGSSLIWSQDNVSSAGTSGTSSTLPWVDASSYATINDALAAIGSTAVTLVISNTQAVASNTTIPTTVSVMVLKPGKFVVAASKTLTINGPFTSGLFQCFDTTASGSSVVFGAGSVSEVYPEWWGAASSSSLQSAISSISKGIVNATNMGSWTATSGVVVKQPLRIVLGAGTITTPTSGVMFDVAFDGSTCANYGELIGTNGTVIKMTQGCSAAVKNNECLWTRYKNITIDMNSATNASGFYLYGGWYVEIDGITIKNGSVHSTSHAFYIDSHTNGVPGITGSYGGAYVNKFSNCQGRDLYAVGHGTSAVTTTTFINCDFQQVNLDLCRQITFLQPVIQPLAADTVAVTFTNTASVTLIGGDFEFAAACVMYKFIGSNRGVQSINNTVTQTATGNVTYIYEATSNNLSAGNYFMDDVASGTTTINHICGYWGSSQDLQFANTGYTNKHHLGTQFDGNVVVLSNNITATSYTQGNLDDTSKNGYALMMDTSGQLLMKFASAGANPRTFSSIALFDNQGLLLGNIPAYASNAAALSGGLTVGRMYRNGDIVQIVH